MEYMEGKFRLVCRLLLCGRLAHAYPMTRRRVEACRINPFTAGRQISRRRGAVLTRCIRCACSALQPCTRGSTHLTHAVASSHECHVRSGREALAVLSHGCFGTIFVVFQKRTPSISRPRSCRRCICAGMVFRPQSSARMVRLGLGCCLLAVLGSCCSHAPRQPKKSCSVSTHRRAFQRCQRQQTKKINPHDGGQGAEGQGVRKPGDATLGPCRSWTTRAGGNTNWGS